MTSKQFCLKWNNFQSNILNAFESLQNTEDLTDVTLTCEGINVKAHKFILSACSPYFRTVFKENPCSHPIIILKDVFYTDLIAIINFMYHGEVLVSEEQLASFLQTAKLLQVSGLNTPNDNVTRKSSSPIIKHKPKKLAESPEVPIKKPKVIKKSTEVIFSDIDESNESPSVRTEAQNQQDYATADVNRNVEVIDCNKSEQSSSILEAALEKCDSILERSLTGDTKPIFIPRKPPDDRAMKSSSSGSCSPPPPTDLLQPTIKIEEDDDGAEEEDQNHSESEATMENLQQRIILDAQPHHSSQCGNCPHCGKVYSNQSALKYHVRLVHSDLTNMYCCHLCPEAFNYREGYKKHMVEVHCIRN